MANNFEASGPKFEHLYPSWAPATLMVIQIKKNHRYAFSHYPVEGLVTQGQLTLLSCQFWSILELLQSSLSASEKNDQIKKPEKPP